MGYGFVCGEAECSVQLLRDFREETVEGGLYGYEGKGLCVWGSVGGSGYRQWELGRGNLGKVLDQTIFFNDFEFWVYKGEGNNRFFKGFLEF